MKTRNPLHWPARAIASIAEWASCLKSMNGPRSQGICSWPRQSTSPQEIDEVPHLQYSRTSVQSTSSHGDRVWSGSISSSCCSDDLTSLSGRKVPTFRRFGASDATFKASCAVDLADWTTRAVFALSLAQFKLEWGRDHEMENSLNTEYGVMNNAFLTPDSRTVKLPQHYSRES